MDFLGVSLACVDVLMLMSLPAWNAGVGTDRQGTLWGGGMGRRVPVTLGKGTGLGFQGPLRRSMCEAAKVELGAPDPLPLHECPGHLVPVLATERHSVSMNNSWPRVPIRASFN